MGPAWSLLRGRDLDRLQGVPYWPVGRRLLQPRLLQPRWRHSSPLAVFGSSIPGAELTSEPFQVFKLAGDRCPQGGAIFSLWPGANLAATPLADVLRGSRVSEKTQRQRGRRQEAGRSEWGRETWGRPAQYQVWDGHSASPAPSLLGNAVGFWHSPGLPDGEPLAQPQVTVPAVCDRAQQPIPLARSCSVNGHFRLRDILIILLIDLSSSQEADKLLTFLHVLHR